VSLGRWRVICGRRMLSPCTWPRTILVQACQQLQGPIQRDHTWLVEHHDPCDTSPGLTLPLLSSSRPRCCSQSRFGLTLTPPARGLRLHCPAGFIPRRYQRRMLRWKTPGRTGGCVSHILGRTAVTSATSCRTSVLFGFHKPQGQGCGTPSCRQMDRAV